MPNRRADGHEGRSRERSGLQGGTDRSKHGGKEARIGETRSFDTDSSEIRGGSTPPSYEAYRRRYPDLASDERRRYERAWRSVPDHSTFGLGYDVRGAEHEADSAGPAERDHHTPNVREGRGEGHRGWWDKARDEVSSWFGDHDAERRRAWDAQAGHADDPAHPRRPK